MKRILPRLLILSFLLPAHFISYSQNLTGIWRGYFITESGEEYKFELQLEQKGNFVSGVSYSYLSTVFYGKATLTGSFNRTANNALIQEIKTIEVRMSLSSVACIMKCMFEYAKSGREEFLEGTFSSQYEKNTVEGKRGTDCGDGKVYLRKVTTSDFYVEPFLRNKVKRDSLDMEARPFDNNGTPISKKEEPVKKTPITSRPITKTNTPTTKSPVVKKTAGNQTKPIVKSNTNLTNKNTKISTTNTPAKRIDSVKMIEVPVENNKLNVKTSNSPDVLKDRQNELVKTLLVTDPNLVIKLYDNGEIDGDSISVYLDKKLLLEHKMLTASPIIIKLKMDEDNTQHELIMVAENLGRIPPNTSLMIVESGDKRYDVFITSTEQKNAVVRFKYQKVK